MTNRFAYEPEENNVKIKLETQYCDSVYGLVLYIFSIKCIRSLY